MLYQPFDENFEGTDYQLQIPSLKSIGRTASEQVMPSQDCESDKRKGASKERRIAAMVLRRTPAHLCREEVGVGPGGNLRILLVCHCWLV